MGKLFNFKPIETKFDGFRFRSRLEARWAVFFKTLGIPYEYEKEGYHLEGIPYLPDFWLPEQEFFVEIKGEKPTEEERKKTQLLSLYMQKYVATFYGTIDVPDEDNLHSFLDYFPRLSTYPLSERGYGGPSETCIQVPSYLLALLQRISEGLLKVWVDMSEEGPKLMIEPDRIASTVGNLHHLHARLSQQLHALLDIQETFKEHEKELQILLTPADGWEMVFFSQATENEQAIWTECSSCGFLDISLPYPCGHGCKDGRKGTFLSNTPRLLAAYNAARSARF